MAPPGLVLATLRLQGRACTASPPCPHHHRRNPPYSVIRILPNSDDEMKEVMNLMKTSNVEHVEVWLPPRTPGLPVDIMVTPDKKDTIVLQLEDTGLKWRVMIEDVQELIDEQIQQQQQQQQQVITYEENAFNYTRYNEYDEILSWIDNIASQYSSIVTKLKLTESYEGRDIFTLKLGKVGSNKPIIFYNGGIHAREWLSPATVIYMTKLMLDSYGTDTEMTELLDEIDWYVTPLLNPDGYVYSWTQDRLWANTRSLDNKTGCFGVNGNLNYDIHWGEFGCKDPCATTPCYDGPNAFSEVEVKALADLILSLGSRVKVYLDIHCYSQVMVTPYLYTSDRPKDFNKQKTLANKVVNAIKSVHGKTFLAGSAWDILPSEVPASGLSCDWTYDVANITYSYGIELRDTGEYGFVIPASNIQPSGEEMVAGMKVLGHHILNSGSRSYNNSLNVWQLVVTMLVSLVMDWF
ncbi:carboxypeptidase B-like [Amphiura filiformis]|uniref:carboxypeptidase B-like n=1 Tax=Amphiura filiformis TaxID=82378 RepID=UPI003B20F54C